MGFEIVRNSREVAQFQNRIQCEWGLSDILLGFQKLKVILTIIILLFILLFILIIIIIKNVEKASKQNSGLVNTFTANTVYNIFYFNIDNHTVIIGL